MLCVSPRPSSIKHSLSFIPFITMSELALTDQNFDHEVLKEKSKPVLVDFWATWCAPCKMQSPIVEDLAKEYEGKAKVGSLEVDESPQTAQKYGILSIPTLLIFKDGKVVWQGIGLHRREQIKQALDSHV